MPNEYTPIPLKVITFQANKSSKKLVARNKIIDFDTVYVNSNPPIVLSDTIYNCSSDSVQVKNQNFHVISPIPQGEEISYSTTFPNEKFFPKFIDLPWVFTYAPKDTGLDSATFSLEYKPELLEPSTVNLTRGIRGFGGIQKAELIGASNTIIVDTIDLGMIDLGVNKEIYIDIKNTGNIPINGSAEIKKIICKRRNK